ncbi:MAG: cysteine--tRNA ligase [Candidatus Saccharibacteria bacterium]
MIQVYNTQARQKEELQTVEPQKVRMYVCGPTTYNYIHLGNARPLVVFDTVRRYLKYRGYDVTYVQNFTDVDDKIINRANEEGMGATELAQRYIEEYFKDADALNVMRADVHPKVSEHMVEIIDMVSVLIDKGHAYEVDGDVYFRVSSFPSYGKLSGRDLEDMLAGARVEVDERKESPMDFALWKKAKPGEPYWDSPWGQGRPGWHIECSAMSMKYLGGTLDIHGGGADLVFPHHENEVAQSEAYTGQPFVRHWLHNGFITVNKEKMSKSLGNFFIVRDILDKFPSRVVRFYLLATHYRSPLDFDDGKLEDAKRALERLQNCWRLLTDAECEANDKESTPEETKLLGQIDNIHVGFVEAMDDDFNTALGVSRVFEMVRLINTSLAEGRLGSKAAIVQVKKTLYSLISDVLGIEIDIEVRVSSDSQLDATNAISLVEAVINALLQFRVELRNIKDYSTADRVRDLLSSQAIIVEDSKEGSRFRFDTEPDINTLMSDVIALRQALRQEKNFTAADLLRDSLTKAGIILEDTKEGCRWRIKD